MTVPASPVGFHDSRLSVPTLAEGAVDRQRLTQRMDEWVRTSRVTLVTGGAGTGKTYAVAAWSRSAASDADVLAVAWASLDRSDGDPRRFWVTVVGALQRVVESAQLARLSVPARSSQHLVDTVASALAEVEERVVLVLDDVHEIFGTQALELLEQLQRALPGQHRLVLVSRYDPPLRLNRLRLAGELCEIRAGELVFTRAEAAQLLRAGGSDLPEDALEDLMTTTEGWAAGLRLATLAIASASDPRAALAQFGGRDAMVSAYLVEEVMAGLGEERAEFLLRTSVVDRVCAPLARALTDVTSSGALLESLVADQALVSSLEHSGWYRYHPMLLQMLRSRLRARDPDLTADLHRRAREWFEGAGEWIEALRHALLADDEDAASQLVLRSAAILVFTAERSVLAEALAPLAGRGVSTEDPERELCLALRGYGLGDGEATDAWLRRAGEGLDALPEPRREIATVVHRLLVSAQARRRGDPGDMLDAAQEALDVASGLPPGASTALPIMRSVAISMAGVAQLWRGRPDVSEELLRSSVIDADERTYGMYARLDHWGLIALSEMSRGYVRSGERTARSVLAAARAAGWTGSYESAAVWLALAVGGLYRADPSEVERCLALARSTRVGRRDPFLGAVTDIVDARAALTAHDLARARRAVARIDRLKDAHPRLTMLSTMSGALLVETTLADGEPHAAAAVLEALDARLAGLGDDQPPPVGPLVITRGHVLLATGHPERAMDVVAPLLDDGGVAASEAWLVTALAQDRLRLDASSAASLTRALALAEAEQAPLGFLRTNDRLPHLLRRHVDVLGPHHAFVAHVLAMVDVAAGRPQDPGSPAAGVEPLTERELSVLAYLPTLSTNPEIAEQLSISVNTVKQHLKTINRKLGVTRKRDAVRVARRLGHLPYPG